MRIAIASDHAGFRYKQRVTEELARLGHEVVDFGADSREPSDYPLLIRPAAQAVASGDCERGIVLGGSGNGEAMVANRVRGVRCALCWSVEAAELGRRHNDANVIAIGQRMVSLEVALAIVHTWLDTPFDGGRHARRVAQLDGDPMGGEATSGGPTSAEPMSGGPTSAEPMSGGPTSAEPMSGEPVSGELVSGEPMSGEPMSGEAVA